MKMQNDTWTKLAGGVGSASSRTMARRGSFFALRTTQDTCRAYVAAILLLVACTVSAGDFIEIKDGYFWDPAAGNYWVPHGISYQVWNPPVFATQTFAQIDYDLSEIERIYADSLRVEFTWGEVEHFEGVYNFTNTDYLISKAEELGLKLFILIGYQYPPAWCTSNYPARMARHYDSVAKTYGQSGILNYSHPDARSTYTSYLAAVCGRYKDSEAVAAWIVGNEFAFYDLWEANAVKRFVGYDTNYSEPSYHNWLSNTYGTVGALNVAWATSHANFDAVPMALAFPPDRENQLGIQQSGYNDLIKWRKQVIGDFLAQGAAAAKSADTNHLVTYAMVGGIFNGSDQNITSEDAPTIIARCQAAGAPLDFWTINNYPWTLTGSEMRSGDFGVSKYRDVIDIPLLLSETGLSDTDDAFTETAKRQAPALASTVWEALMSGAIGAHIFHWSDRDQFPSGQQRERGFGIVEEDRTIKNPVFYNIVDAYRRMAEIDISTLLGNSSDPDNQVLLYWSDDADLGWGRANQEDAMIWGAFKRTGLQIGIIDGDGFDNNEWLGADALFLSRNFQMDSNHLDLIETAVIATGIHVHANADLPGRFGPHHETNANWPSRMSSIFGLNVSSAVPGWDAGSTNRGDWPADYKNINSYVVQNLGPLDTIDAMRHFGTWKIWHGIASASGTTIVTQTGREGSQAAMPGLHVKDHGAGKGKAAVNTFALGDIIPFFGDGNPNDIGWTARSDFLEAIYTNYFGLTPDVTVSGSRNVMVDRRICANGSQIISLLNVSSNDATVTISASVLSGKKVENLTDGGIVTNSSTGTETIDVDADQMVWLYVYSASGGTDASLVNPNPRKVWIQDAPMCVWPSRDDEQIEVRYDTQGSNLNLYVTFERVYSPDIVYGMSAVTSVTGAGTVTLSVPILDADLGDTNYISSAAGGQYVFHAWLEATNGWRVTDTEIPACLLWGVRPVSVPTNPAPSTVYGITVRWEDLPSYLQAELPTPLNRADVWPEETDDVTEEYLIILQLVSSNGTVVTSNSVITSTGTDSNIFSVTTPATLNDPPYAWQVRLVSDLWGPNKDVIDGFEDRTQGEGAGYVSPWVAFAYDENAQIDVWSRGVDTNSSEGDQGAFVVVNNPNPGGWSGFGMAREYAEPWALPHPSEWSNIFFAFDFIETNMEHGTLTMKVEDSGDGAIEYTMGYAGGWVTLSNALNNFTNSPWPDTFDPDHVDALSVLLQTFTSTGLYFSSFDNIRFVGTTSEWQGGSISDDLIDSFEDRTLGDQQPTTPWYLGCFGTGGQYYQNYGHDGNASDGSKGSFHVFWSHTNALGTSAWYMAYTYAEAFALPPDLSNVLFAFDFYEDNSRGATLEMQVKDSGGGTLVYNKTYVPGGWDTISATLDQFSGSIDTNDVKEIDVLVYMHQYDIQYVGHIDYIRFTGTVSTILAEQTNGWFTSSDDVDTSIDSDGDGIPDAYETDTDTYVNGRDTGTDPNDDDSDDDGQKDGDELLGGSDPNDPDSTFAFDIMDMGGSGFDMTWFGRMDRIYTVEYLDGNLVTDDFLPLNNYVTTDADGMITIGDTPAPTTAHRYYRLRARGN